MTETEDCHSSYSEQTFTIAENDTAYSMKGGQCMAEEDKWEDIHGRVRGFAPGAVYRDRPGVVFGHHRAPYNPATGKLDHQRAMVKRSR